jgi:hypothetical protein
MANRKDYGKDITANVVSDAVERFLANGGEIQVLRTEDPNQKNADWITTEFVAKVREDRKLTAEDLVVDSNDYSSASE